MQLWWVALEEFARDEPIRVHRALRTTEHETNLDSRWGIVWQDMGSLWSTPPEGILKEDKTKTDRELRRVKIEADKSARKIAVLERERAKAPEWQQPALEQTLEHERIDNETILGRQQTLLMARTTNTQALSAIQLRGSMEHVNKALEATSHPREVKKQDAALDNFARHTRLAHQRKRVLATTMNQLRAETTRDSSSRNGGGGVTVAAPSEQERDFRRRLEAKPVSTKNDRELEEEEQDLLRRFEALQAHDSVRQ
jgi:hypothetical protein